MQKSVYKQLKDADRNIKNREPDDILEDNANNRVEGRVSSELKPLLACPDCNGLAKDYCKIDIQTDRWQTTVPLNNKKCVQAQCKRCGFCISILTENKSNLIKIRELWNIMAN